MAAMISQQWRRMSHYQLQFRWSVKQKYLPSGGETGDMQICVQLCAVLILYCTPRIENVNGNIWNALRGTFG